MGEYLGIGLMIAGAVLFFFGRRRSNRLSVRASRGSVAVGGNNIGSITNINQTNEGSSGGHGLTVVSILVELAGIAAIVWHVLHLASK
jgi:hypothetical protein